MKYFRIFDTTEDYFEYMETENAIRPNISYCSGDGKTYLSECEINSLVISSYPFVSANTYSCNAIANSLFNVTAFAEWSVISGSQFATIGSSNGVINISAMANESTIVIQAIYGGVIATKEMVVTYTDGPVSEKDVETTVDASGNTIVSTIVVTTYRNGTSLELSNSIVTDINGNLVKTTETTKNKNADGSYESVTTNYDNLHVATDSISSTGDILNNIDTRYVSYDENGNSIVTGYKIETDGHNGKTLSGDVLDTGFYAFDTEHGFETEINFIIDFSKQPPSQDDDIHTILISKRSNASPYYGFALRRDEKLSANYNRIRLGVAFENGTTSYTGINPTQIVDKVARYDIKITYDPTLQENNFVCRDITADRNVAVLTGKFKDIEELKQYTVSVGCSKISGDEYYRYSNIKVLNFSIKKIR